MYYKAVEKERKVTGLQTSINIGRLAGLEDRQVYCNLLNGRNNGVPLSKSDLPAVGRALSVV